MPAYFLRIPRSGNFHQKLITDGRTGRGEGNKPRSDRYFRLLGYINDPNRRENTTHKTETEEGGQGGGATLLAASFPSSDLAYFRSDIAASIAIGKRSA